MQYKTRQSGAASTSPQVLDARTLGRPVHLLGRFTAQLQEDFADTLRQQFNRRYGSQFQVAVAAMVCIDAAPPAARWLACVSEDGRIDVATDRGVVLRTLDYRYGVAGIPASADENSRAEPTTTEERQAERLALSFTLVLANCVYRLSHGTASTSADALRIDPMPGATSVVGRWMIEASIGEPDTAPCGVMRFVLDDAWMRRLLGALAPTRPARGLVDAALPPFAERLQLSLCARLLEQEITLGRLLDAHIGDVIPVSLGATQVLIEDSLLYTAQVAEHRGKLCLTSFDPTS